jgi:hypothetical protein
VTGGAVQPAAFKTLTRHVLSADRIVRAQHTHAQRLHQMILKMARLLTRQKLHFA